MFDTLSEKLQQVFQGLSRKGKLSEGDVDGALREVRLALLEADVHFRVVREFVDAVRKRAAGADLLRSLTPAQQVVKIVHEELIGLLGEPGRLTTTPNPPTVIMLVGLQGSGKTTTAAKLALRERTEGRQPMLVAADPRRPAAVSQLQLLAQEVEVPVFAPGGVSAAEVCRLAVREARRSSRSPVIVDTGGRLHTDDELMDELEQIRAAIDPAEVLLVADGTSGQDALKVAQEFHGRVGLTGAILTKLDGDARGGAALSLRAATGVPIKFLGVGERPQALEPFYPDRLAGRILGMGDVLSLVERAQGTIDATRAQELQRKMRSGAFDLEDLLEQLRQMQRMGPLEQILAMVPGLGGRVKGMADAVDERQVRQMEAIILSMTTQERKRPEIIGGSRRRRIARGSGTSQAQVNQLLHQHQQMQRLIKGLAGRKKGMDLGRLFQ